MQNESLIGNHVVDRHPASKRSTKSTRPKRSPTQPSTVTSGFGRLGESSGSSGFKRLKPGHQRFIDGKANARSKKDGSLVPRLRPSRRAACCFSEPRRVSGRAYRIARCLTLAICISTKSTSRGRVKEGCNRSATTPAPLMVRRRSSRGCRRIRRDVPSLR
jgi:hypothetical protein